ncbi:hypothetical protein TNCV_1126281 [Trichonephila clavipes]|nr:hypothetical protein TNCV_1126281 [Trichonephila clavipes]
MSERMRSHANNVLNSQDSFLRRKSGERPLDGATPEMALALWGFAVCCKWREKGVCGGVKDQMTDERLGFLFLPVATGGGEALQKGKEEIPLDAFGGIRRQ